MQQYGRLDQQTEVATKEREELRIAELDLMKERERVADMRRRLSTSTPIKNYDLQEASISGPQPHGAVIGLDQLVSADRATIVYQFMFGKKQEDPCPMCSMWIDGFSGVARHLQSKVNLLVVAAAGPDQLREYGAKRGWNSLRLLSSAQSSFNYDLGSEDAEGNQSSAVSVLSKSDSGQISHFYTVTPAMAKDQHERGIDLLSPVWSLLDLTPEGRGSWYPSLDYDD